MSGNFRESRAMHPPMNTREAKEGRGGMMGGGYFPDWALTTQKINHMLCFILI